MENPEYQFNERMIVNDKFILNNIYIDITFLKYVQLGPILTHQNLNAPMYTRIVDIINDPNFVNRNTNDPSVIFKSVPNIENVLIPSNHHEDIQFSISPSFHQASELINFHIKKSDNEKRVAGINTPTKITIDLSIYNNLTDKLCNRIATEYADTFECDINLTLGGLTALNKVALNFDAYYVGDLGRFNSIMLDYLNRELLANKYFFCSKVLPLSQTKELDDDTITTTFNNINLVMSAASRFQFIDPFPCMKRG